MGGEGEYAPDIAQQVSTPEQMLSQQFQMQPGVVQALQAYGTGQMGLQEALAQAQQAGLGQAQALQGEEARLLDAYKQRSARGEPLEPDERANMQRLEQKQEGLQQAAQVAPQRFMEQLATDPLTGTRFATEQVRGGISGDIFGGGGLQERLGTEEQRLAQTGFQLTPEDREAYAQVSGDITRQFGQREQGIAQALAARGLSASPAAQAAFTGAAGSKMEQLSGIQRQIAEQRMQRTQQRLAQTRQQMLQTGQLGQQAVGAQFGRQLGGRQQRQQELAMAAQQEAIRRQQQQQQQNIRFQQQQETKGPGVGGVLGGIVGGGVSALTGGLGSTVGAGLGKSILGG